MRQFGCDGNCLSGSVLLFTSDKGVRVHLLSMLVNLVGCVSMQLIQQSVTSHIDIYTVYLINLYLFIKRELS